MTRFFLSYRRDDSAGFAGRLADDLEAAFGAGSVFRDVDDIPPGEDFARVIESRLVEVGAVLVMIGPRWLAAGASGRRRLDEPEDFVRREIEAALASGKMVIPLLVGGAVMPAASELPAGIAELARRQAVVLADSGWRQAVSSLVATLKTTTRPRRGGKVFALAGAILALLALAWAAQVWRQPAAPPRHIDIAGRWSAQVKYDWGAEHRETFEFLVSSGQVGGSAGYLRLPRSIESGRLEGSRLSFVTHSDEVIGEAPPRQVTHRYEGEVTTHAIRFRLVSQGGYSSHPPVEFVASRDEK